MISEQLCHTIEAVLESLRPSIPFFGMLHKAECVFDETESAR